MRTTVEISESLLKRVRRIMKKRGVTLRALVEEGLERVVREQAPETGFELADARFEGELGFAPGAGPEAVARVLREMNEPDA